MGTEHTLNTFTEIQTTRWLEEEQTVVTITQYQQFFHCLWLDIQEFKAISVLKKHQSRGFPGGAVVESLPANAGDTGSRPGLGGSHMPRSN